MKLVAGIVHLPSRWPEGSASYRRFKEKKSLAGHGASNDAAARLPASSTSTEEEAVVSRLDTGQLRKV
jgi:hypothetical protein